MLRIALIAAAAAAAAAVPLAAVPGRKAEMTPALVADVADTWILEHPADRTLWAWGEGVLIFGMVEAFRATNEARFREYVREYALFWQERDVAIVWSDSCSPAIGPIDLVLKNNDTDLLPIVDKVVQFVMTAPRTEVQGLLYHLGIVPIRNLPNLLPDAWIDSIFHISFTLARYTELTNEIAFREESVFQMRGFLTNLQDPVTGLVTHSYNDFPNDFRVPEYDTLGFWARGNGWAIASLVDTISQLPADHPALSELNERVQTLAAALIPLQTPRGLFRTVLLNETTYEETAGSALITYGLIRGAREGIFGAEALEAGRRGIDGLLDVVIYENGRTEIGETSIGTNPTYRLYPYIPQQPQVSYGVGSWLMAARQYLLAKEEGLY